MKRCPVLVTGGAGFIGSHTCKALSRAGYQPIAYDSLVNGRTEAVQWGPLEQGCLGDRDRLLSVFTRYAPRAVLHFAGYIEAGESVRDPQRFYTNNVARTLVLLDVMRACGVRHLVFSSSAAVYGTPLSLPLSETHPLAPVNPYGWTKAMVEQILADLAAAAGLRYSALRYFNASGADPEGALTETHSPETHLIPLAIQSALGGRPPLLIFGTDYDTPDGTCVRDYVHVSDLADAHVLALRYLLEGGPCLVANLGLGRGISVREVVDAVGAVMGRPVPTQVAPRRAGDPAILVADPTRANKILNWHPRHTALTDHIRHAVAAFSRPTPLL